MDKGREDKPASSKEEELNNAPLVAQQDGGEADSKKDDGPLRSSVRERTLTTKGETFQLELKQ